MLTWEISTDRWTTTIFSHELQPNEIVEIKIKSTNKMTEDKEEVSDKNEKREHLNWMKPILKYSMEIISVFQRKTLYIFGSP